MLGGNGTTLEPTLKLNQNTLSVLVSSYSPQQKANTAVKIDASSTPNTIGGSTPAVKQGAMGNDTIPSSDAKSHNNAIIAIRKAGTISTNVLTINGGQKVVPVL